MSTTTEHEDGAPPPLRSVQNTGSGSGLKSLTAAAKRLTDKLVQRIGNRGILSKQDDLGWEQDAWDTYDLVGEQRFLANAIAGRMAQARIYVAKVGDDPTQPPVPLTADLAPGDDRPEGYVAPTDTDRKAAAALAAFGDTPQGRARLIERMGQSQFMVGKGWFVGIPTSIIDTGSPTEDNLNMGRNIIPTPDASNVSVDDLVWKMLSVSEVKNLDTNSVDLYLDSRIPRTFNLNHIFLIKIWRQHPRWSWQSDSPVRSSLPVLRELIGLTMHISAQIDSRLAGAGIFLIPQGAKDALMRQTGNQATGDSNDPFVEAVMDAAGTAIENRSSAEALMPIMVTVPGEEIEYFRYITFATPLDAEARPLREESIRRVALGEDAPPDLLLASACVDTETQILTSNGWVTEDRLNVGDLILTLNHDTGLSEWHPVQIINRYERDAVPMLHMSGKGHDSLTTLNHKWPVIRPRRVNGMVSDVREFTTSEELNTSHRIPTAAPVADLPTDAKYADDFVELVAWYWTEGSTSTNLATGRRQAMIGQSHTANPHKVAAIRGALTRLFGEGNWGSEHQRHTVGLGGAITTFSLRKHVYEALQSVVPGGDKIVSLDFVRALTRAQLELFIQTSCDGDGWHYKQGHLDIWQKNPEALGAYELALILSGRMVSTTEYNGGTVVNAYTKSTVRPVKAALAPNARSITITREEYTGIIWCPTVQNSTWLAKRNGTVWFTGNSKNHWGEWLQQEDTVRNHVAPPLNLILDGLTTEYLWEVLEQDGVPKVEAQTYVIVGDVEHLIVRPNKSQDAKDAKTFGVISDEAYRDAVGFTDDDAPSEGEQSAFAIALDLVRATPALAKLPGLPSLVQQIQSVLDGVTPPEMPVQNPRDVGIPGSPQNPDDTPGMVPDTSGNPAAPPAVTASAGNVEPYDEHPDWHLMNLDGTTRGETE